jgi:hypothetical protein
VEYIVLEHLLWETELRDQRLSRGFG